MMAGYAEDNIREDVDIVCVEPVDKVLIEPVDKVLVEPIDKVLIDPVVDGAESDVDKDVADVNVDAEVRLEDFFDFFLFGFFSNTTATSPRVIPVVDARPSLPTLSHKAANMLCVLTEARAVAIARDDICPGA